jgi:hypothetical protein
LIQLTMSRKSLRAEKRFRIRPELSL